MVQVQNKERQYCRNNTGGKEERQPKRHMGADNIDSHDTFENSRKEGKELVAR